MVAHAPASYYQHDQGGPSHNYPIAHANPAFFQPGYLNGSHPLMTGRKGRHGRKARKARKPSRLHGSPLVSFRDPWGHRGMGRTRGR